MPNDIKTEPSLLKRLHASAGKSLTREQMFKQRVSFIYGSLPQDSTITRQQIVEVLSGEEGQAA